MAPLSHWLDCRCRLGAQFVAAPIRGDQESRRPKIKVGVAADRTCGLDALRAPVPDRAPASPITDTAGIFLRAAHDRPVPIAAELTRVALGSFQKRCSRGRTFGLGARRRLHTSQVRPTKGKAT